MAQQSSTNLDDNTSSKPSSDVKKKEKVEEKNKFTNVFERFTILLSQRKKENQKTYFQKITLGMLALIIGISIMCSVCYTNILQVTTSEKSYALLYIPIIVICAGSLLIYKTKYFYPISYSSIPLIMLGYTLYYFLGVHTGADGTISTTIWYIFGVMIIGIGAGLLFSTVLISFLFVMSNSERLLASILVTTLIITNRFFNFIDSNIAVDYIIPMICSVASFFLIFSTKKESGVEVEFSTEEKLSKSTLIMLIVVVIITIINNGTMRFLVGKISSLNLDYIRLSDLDISFFVGFILSCVATIILFAFVKKSLFVLFNFYLVSSVLGYLFGIFYYVFFANSLIVLTEIFFGFSCSIGLISTIMLTGKVLEDKVSKKYYYVITGVITIAFLIIMFYFMAIRYFDLRVLFAIMTVVLFLLVIWYEYFNVFESFLSKSEKVSPVAYIENNQNKYHVINPEEVLTPKEKDIFYLLLEGYTLRQIAGELSMKYDAVNFHYKNIYRKLEVNSKIELLMRYSKR
jgi:DNA-binding CsgD family transcriptional regulator